MSLYSYFLKLGKGTYGLGHTQITADDLALNYVLDDNPSGITEVENGLSFSTDNPNAISLGGSIGKPTSIVIENQFGPTIEPYLRIGGNTKGLKIDRFKITAENDFELNRARFNINPIRGKPAIINSNDSSIELKDTEASTGGISTVKLGQSELLLQAFSKVIIRPGNFSSSQSTEGYVLTKVHSDGEAQWKALPDLGGNSSSRQLLDITLKDEELLFGDTKPFTTLIPALNNQVIIIHHISIAGNIINGVQQDYANVYIAYHNSNFTKELVEVKTAFGKQLFADGTSWDLDEDVDSGFENSLMNTPVVLKGPDGIGTSGVLGGVTIKIEYSYLDLSEVLEYDNVS